MVCLGGWAFRCPCLVCVVEEGFAVVVEDGALGADGYGRVVVRLDVGGVGGGDGDFWIPDCYVAGVVAGYLDGPLSADSGGCGF